MRRCSETHIDPNLVRSTLLEIPSKYSKCYQYNKNLAVVSTFSTIVSPVDVLYETR